MTGPSLRSSGVERVSAEPIIQSIRHSDIGGDLEIRLSRTSTVVAAKDQVSCDLVGEAVILNLKSGVYFGLDPVGARIWNLIKDPKTVGAVIEAILQEYDVDPERCETDVIALLEELANRALLDIKGNPDGTAG